MNIPIIMVTAKKEDIDKIRGLGLGADDYMIKPFSPAELVARVKSHIQIHSMLLAQKRKEEEKGMENRPFKDSSERAADICRRKRNFSFQQRI